MEIQLDTLTADPSELELVAEVEELELRLELAQVLTPVTLRLTAWRIEDEIFLDGTVGYTVQFTCARCVNEFEEPRQLPLNLVLQLVNEDSVAAADAEDDQFVAISASNTKYSLDQHLRDLIALEMPLQPVCREDCQGLCPICGSNRNETKCECRTEREDPRWDALRKLRNSRD